MLLVCLIGRIGVEVHANRYWFHELVKIRDVKSDTAVVFAPGVYAPPSIRCAEGRVSCGGGGRTLPARGLATLPFYPLRGREGELD